MKVLDGRNSHSVPKVIELSEFIVASKYVTTNNNNEVVSIYDLLLDGQRVPCVSSSDTRYKYILCTTYKTERGFMNWLKRMYPYAEKKS